MWIFVPSRRPSSTVFSSPRQRVSFSELWGNARDKSVLSGAVKGRCRKDEPISDIEQLVTEAGFPDFRLVRGLDVVVGQWVRLKCTYACHEYGRQACCPPNVPSVAVSREFFREYDRVAVIHI